MWPPVVFSPPDPNPTGGHNSYFGQAAGYSNLAGNDNCFFGQDAGFLNTGDRNSFFGREAGGNTTSGAFNAFFGSNAGINNSTGATNSFFGAGSGFSNTVGAENTFVGHLAGIANTTGENNTIIGGFANVGGAALTNATAIGFDANVNASNKIRLGNTSVTVIEGQVAYSFPSDARFKYNIQNNVPGLDFIKRLTPVTYYFDGQKLEEYSKTGVINNSIARQVSYNGDKQLHTGFLAQDVEKAAKELGYSFDGVHTPANDRDHYSIAYSQFIMPLVSSVQEQQRIIEQQNLQINKQQKDVEILKHLIDELTKKVNSLVHN